MCLMRKAALHFSIHSKTALFFNAVELIYAVVYVHDIKVLRMRESLPSDSEPPGYCQQTICKFSSDVVARQPAFSIYRWRSLHGCSGCNALVGNS